MRARGAGCGSESGEGGAGEKERRESGPGTARWLMREKSDAPAASSAADAAGREGSTATSESAEQAGSASARQIACQLGQRCRQAGARGSGTAPQHRTAQHAASQLNEGQ
jgi:hypothetical protein